MKNLKSHFRFSKNQRNGIFLLMLIIVGLQALYFYQQLNISPFESESIELQKYQQEIDSLKLAKSESSFPKLYPFNPNYITDHKGYTLGMSNQEIDRLLQFRKQNKWINSAEDFQKVTLISDSLLQVISPYFKFPDWVLENQNKKPTNVTLSNLNNNRTKLNLNTATKAQLILVNGIGEKISERIIEYRNRQEFGFIDKVELKQIYGLQDAVIEELFKTFYIPEQNIEKLDLNTATSDELVKIKYIDYEVAYNIIEYRTLHEGFKSLDELTKVKFFPLNKIDIIKLYLRLN